METTASTEADAVAADRAENDQGGNQPTPLHDEASFKSTLEEHHSLAATSAAARPLALQQDSAGVGLAAGDPSLGPLPLIQDPEEKQESFKLFIGGLPSIMSNGDPFCNLRRKCFRSSRVFFDRATCAAVFAVRRSH